MPFIVPTGSEHADFEEDVDLGGVVFRLRFTYNGRDDSWYVNVSDVDGNPLVMGTRLTLNVSILGAHVEDTLPTGALAMTNPENEREDPARRSLDDDAMALLHFTAEELGS